MGKGCEVREDVRKEVPRKVCGVEKSCDAWELREAVLYDGFVYGENFETVNGFIKMAINVMREWDKGE